MRLGGRATLIAAALLGSLALAVEPAEAGRTYEKSTAKRGSSDGRRLSLKRVIGAALVVTAVCVTGAACQNPAPLNPRAEGTQDVKNHGTRIVKLRDGGWILETRNGDQSRQLTPEYESIALTEGNSSQFALARKPGDPLIYLLHLENGAVLRRPYERVTPVNLTYQNGAAGHSVFAGERNGEVEFFDRGGHSVNPHFWGTIADGAGNVFWPPPGGARRH